MTKYKGPRLILPIGYVKVHRVEKQIVGYRAHCSMYNNSGDRVPIVISIPTDLADIRMDDNLTLYTEIASNAPVN